MKKSNGIKALLSCVGLLSLLSLTSLGGCGRQCPPTPDELDRAREVLDETSPRNLNDHPKVTCKNFIYCFDSAERRRPCPPPEVEE
jgi:hypothetical protein